MWFSRKKIRNKSRDPALGICRLPVLGESLNDSVPSVMRAVLPMPWVWLGGGRDPRSSCGSRSVCDRETWLT